MKSLFTKIISVLTIFTLSFGLCACNTNSNKCATGHTWKLTSTTATCFECGIESFECEVCKTTKTENVNAYGHNLVQSAYTAPTCKTNGEKVEKCSRCGFENKQTLLAVAHDYQVKSTNPSTCTVRGSQTLECSMCHETKTETLPLANHEYRLTDVTPSTCATKGSRTYKCNECTDSYTTELDLLSHNYELKNTTPSTCSTKGSKVYECSTCHNTYSDELPLTAHKYAETLVEEPMATCFTKGAMSKKCDECGHTEMQSETQILIHNFGVDGYCTKCGIYKTLFDENALNVSWSGTPIVTIRGSLSTKFNSIDNSIPDSYWKDHIVTLTISMYDINEELLETHSFDSTTIPHEENYGKLTIQYISTNGTIAKGAPNAFRIFTDEGNIFSLESRQNCKSFKIELSCEGYETIEKTYQINN